MSNQPAWIFLIMVSNMMPEGVLHFRRLATNSPDFLDVGIKFGFQNVQRWDFGVNSLGQNMLIDQLPHFGFRPSDV